MTGARLRIDSSTPGVLSFKPVICKASGEVASTSVVTSTIKTELKLSVCNLILSTSEARVGLSCSLPDRTAAENISCCCAEPRKSSVVFASLSA